MACSLQVVACSLYLACSLQPAACSPAVSEVKQPNVAGAFYPDNRQELETMIELFLDKADVGPHWKGAEVFALISAHAGYGYSGQTAAYGYKLIRDMPYKTVVIIAPSHHYRFSGVSVYPQGAFRTPLGDLEIDSEFTAKLLHKEKEVYFAPAAFDKEHSLEVQLPFLQVALSSPKIVPVIMGDCTLETCKKLAKLLKQAIGQRKDVLVVASTDLYHGYDYEEADLFDKSAIEHLKRMDYESFYYALREGKAQLCGGFAVVTTLALAKDLGYEHLSLLKYTNSAMVSAKKVKGVWTVGYASCAIGKADSAPKENTEKKMILNKEQREKLLHIARSSIETRLRTGKKLEVSESDPLLLKEFGAFVTLHKDGQLRGCIGHIQGSQPLYLTVRDMAVEAAIGDPRFPPLKPDELKDIEVEVSVLSLPEKADSADKIELGVHGVIVKRGSRSGVFLPQVATETGWSKEEFLSYLCAHKAGLPADCWKDPATEIYLFTAEVFSEANY